MRVLSSGHGAGGGLAPLGARKILGGEGVLVCKKGDLGVQNGKTQHGPKMAFSSTRSFSTIRDVKRSTGSGRAAPLKIGFFFGTHVLSDPTAE